MAVISPLTDSIWSFWPITGLTKIHFILAGSQNDWSEWCVTQPMPVQIHIFVMYGRITHGCRTTATNSSGWSMVASQMVNFILNLVSLEAYRHFCYLELAISSLFVTNMLFAVFRLCFSSCTLRKEHPLKHQTKENSGIGPSGSSLIMVYSFQHRESSWLLYQ